ncbi:MAG: ABC transporter permease subunit [Verrucomicrobiota bacterium]
MQRLLAIAWLTWKAALRYRLFWVLAALLVGAVVGLPLLIKDDGTARGFTQILMTYTLSAITALLGIATLWLACGTLARDIEEAQIQLVVVKPIARWQIWIGKWLGLISLNAVLLALAGGSVFFLLQWRANRLSPQEQKILRNEVLVARAGVKEVLPDINEVVEKELQRRLQSSSVNATNIPAIRKQIQEQIKAGIQSVRAGGYRPWKIQLGRAKDSLRDQPLFLRVKFFTPQSGSSATFIGLWQVGNPDTKNFWRSEPMSLSAETFHEFAVPANLFDSKGELDIVFVNPNETTLLFPLEDGLEVLYREGTFALNFVRGLGIIFCWLALLATLGLATASLLSFPVAAFVSLAVLVMALSSGTLSSVVQEGTLLGVNHESGAAEASSLLDTIFIPFFKAALKVINLVQGFSPIDSLSTGRSITWTQLGTAVAQIVLLLGGIMSVIGIILFHRRELGAAQSNS